MTGSTKRPNWRPSCAENRRTTVSKVCTKCGESKTLAEFHLRDGRSRKYKARDPRRYKSRCKECVKAVSAIECDPGFKPDRNPKTKSKNTKTPAQKRAVNAEYKRGVRIRSRIKALQYLADKGCCDCGIHDPRVLDFDHLDPADKSDNVSKLLCDGYSWGAERLRAEIRKCRVICSNCHRLHTGEQMEYYGHDDIQTALRDIDAKYSIS